jgi:hypothetical protein
MDPELVIVPRLVRVVIVPIFKITLPPLLVEIDPLLINDEIVP